MLYTQEKKSRVNSRLVAPIVRMHDEPPKIPEIASLIEYEEEGMGLDEEESDQGTDAEDE